MCVRVCLARCSAASCGLRSAVPIPPTWWWDAGGRSTHGSNILMHAASPISSLMWSVFCCPNPLTRWWDAGGEAVRCPMSSCSLHCRKSPAAVCIAVRPPQTIGATQVVEAVSALAPPCSLHRRTIPCSSPSDPSPSGMMQVVEAGLGHLPFRERTVITPTGAAWPLDTRSSLAVTACTPRTGPASRQMAAQQTGAQPVRQAPPEDA